MKPNRTQIIVNEQKLNSFPLTSVMWQEGQLFFNIVLEFLAQEILQNKEMKGIQIGKEQVNISLFKDEMI
jgi:hypothetical protein